VILGTRFGTQIEVFQLIGTGIMVPLKYPESKPNWVWFVDPIRGFFLIFFWWSETQDLLFFVFFCFSFSEEDPDFFYFFILMIWNSGFVVFCYFFLFWRRSRPQNWNSPNLFLGRILSKKSKKGPPNHNGWKLKHVVWARETVSYGRWIGMSALDRNFLDEHVKFVVRLSKFWYLLPRRRLNNDWWARESLVAFKACTYEERPFPYGKHSKSFFINDF